MNVFVSWSGARSKEAAASLTYWIRSLLPSLEVWISTELPAGGDWRREIALRLREADLGILCLTEENRTSPWLLFEAGALAQYGRLLLYVVDFDASELVGPLSRFQALSANEDGTWRLVAELNDATHRHVPEDELRRSFHQFWPRLHKALAGIDTPRTETGSVVIGDVVGSSRMVATAGGVAGFGKILSELFTRVDDVARNKVQSIKFLGDSFLSVFANSNDAFSFALEVQRSLSEKPLLVSGMPVTMRIGIDRGVILRSSEHIIGSAVNVAARIASLADPGQIVISQDALAQLADESRSKFSPLEQIELKGSINRAVVSRYDPHQ